MNARIEILPGFSPVSVLWEGEAPPFPSEQSALWALRQMKSELAQAEAIALLRGRTMVNVEKFVQVVQRRALDAAKKRWANG